MQEFRPNRERCDPDLAPDSADALERHPASNERVRGTA
jgi:hypothetical protein